MPHSISGWVKGKLQHHGISSGDLQVSSIPFSVGANPCLHVEVEEVQGVWLASEGAARGPGQRRVTDLLPRGQSLCRPALMSEAGNSTLFSEKSLHKSQNLHECLQPRKDPHHGHTSLQERVGDTGQPRAQGSHLPASTRDAHATRGEQSCSTGTLFKRKQVAF